MGIKVIDVGTSQRNLDFGLARRDGWEACYVKLGGDNSGRYVAPNYVSQVDRARAAGMRVGHYWVPNASQDPTAAADYFVNNLRGWSASDFAVLDNESLDGAVRYGDSAAAVWVNRVKARLGISGARVFTYSGLADARVTAWPAVLSTGSNFIIAAYSYGPLQIPSIPTIPASRIAGHQYGGGPIGGVITDTNMFVDGAFNYAAGTSSLGNKPLEPVLVIPEGIKEMAEPIYARGDKLDVWYALYLNAEQSNPDLNGSGAIYSGRRKVEVGERAIVEQIGFPHPKQSKVVVIPQETFDGINKLAYSA